MRCPTSPEPQGPGRPLGAQQATPPRRLLSAAGSFAYPSAARSNGSRGAPASRVGRCPAGNSSARSSPSRSSLVAGSSGIAARWYERCRNHPANPFTLTPQTSADALYRPREQTAPDVPVDERPDGPLRSRRRALARGADLAHPVLGGGSMTPPVARSGTAAASPAAQTPSAPTTRSAASTWTRRLVHLNPEGARAARRPHPRGPHEGVGGEGPASERRITPSSRDLSHVCQRDLDARSSRRRWA